MSTDIAKLVVASGAVHLQRDCPCRAYKYGWPPHGDKDQSFGLSGGGKSDLLVDVKGAIADHSWFALWSNEVNPIQDILTQAPRPHSFVLLCPYLLVPFDHARAPFSWPIRLSVLRSDGTLINPPEPGTKVVLVDDVVTTGGTLLRAKWLLEAVLMYWRNGQYETSYHEADYPRPQGVIGYGLKVVRIVVAVDRREVIRVADVRDEACGWLAHGVGPGQRLYVPQPPSIASVPVEALCTEQEIRGVLDA